MRLSYGRALFFNYLVADLSERLRYVFPSVFILKVLIQFFNRFG